MTNLELQKRANEVRKGIVTAVHSAKAGHPGGSLSAADMFTYLYFEEMNIDPKNPKWEERDRFVLSKGHTAPGLYSVLANKEYFPIEDLKTLRKLGSYLQGHPCMQGAPVLWGRVFPWLWEWLLQGRWIIRITVYIPSWETEKFRKARCGRQPCLPERVSWIIW